MPDRPNFPIPENLTPDTFCLCLQIPNDDTWKRVFAGLLAQPAYWFNWQRDDARSGKILSQYWTKLFDEIDWSTMSCCCDSPPALFRYNDAGVYQRSTDGGATWEDAPEFDYRNTSTIFPPPSAIGIDNSQCQAADGAVVTIKTEIVEALNTSFAAAEILGLIAAVLLAVLSAGSLAALTPLITSIGAAIIGVGVTATQAAFTSAVWNRFRCNVFCHMDSASSIDQTGFEAVLAQINTDETGIARTVLYGIVNAAGVVGITNMIRSNKGDAGADCSGCGCGDCTNLADWSIQTFDGHVVGTEVSRGDNFIILSGTSHPDFGTPYNAIIKTPTVDDCCKVTNFETISGDGSDYHLFYVGCGDVQWPTGTFVSWPDMVHTPSANQLFIRKDSGSNFIVKITFAEP